MNKKISRIIATALSAVMLLTSTPVFASSIGSIASDPSIGSDIAQGQKTEYAEVGVGNSSTNVYLTIDDSNIRVGVPTSIIMSGTANENNTYQGKYSVSVSGDMTGDKELVVEPMGYAVNLKQEGKNDIIAGISQDQTVFSSEDLANNTKTNGNVDAYSLTGGTWKGATSFEISLRDREKYSMTYLYVSTTGSDETGDGSADNPFATIYHANSVISDNSKENRYTIKVADGTYTDLQERYAGIIYDEYSGSDKHMMGVKCKDYVYYEGNTENPEKCVIQLDGLYGYDEEDKVTNNCNSKSAFHIGDKTHTSIKGFKSVAKNCRYALHIETGNGGNSPAPSEYTIENCIFEWYGKPDLIDGQSSAETGVVATGSGFEEQGLFKNCEFYNYDEAIPKNALIYTNHDNPATFDGNGGTIIFENCYFYAQAETKDYLTVSFSTKTNGHYLTPLNCILVNCCGNKQIQFRNEGKVDSLVEFNAYGSNMKSTQNIIVK